MTTHPHRKRKGRSPKPLEIESFRKKNNLSQERIAAFIFCSGNSWSQWESGDRSMHPAFWDLVQIRVKEYQIRHKDILLGIPNENPDSGLSRDEAENDLF